ncbi:MAG: transposase [Gallionella sp.]
MMFNQPMDKFNPKIHHRKSIRLKNYDYSQAGLYFITMCTQSRFHLFGEIVNDEMVLNDAGMMGWDEWQKSEKNRDEIKIHEFVVMPNHIHGMVEIPVGAPLVGAQNSANVQPQSGQPQGIAPTVGDIVGGVKSITTNEYIKMVKQPILPRFDKQIWQRNYWEHVIRNENEYNPIAQYMMDNPKKWVLDKLNAGTDLCVCPNRIREQSEIYNNEAWMV